MGNDSNDDRPAMPRKIGCRICMSTATLTAQFSEAGSIDAAGNPIPSSITHGAYECDEAHVTHATFDSADGSLVIIEPEDGPPRN